MMECWTEHVVFGKDKESSKQSIGRMCNLIRW